MQQKERVLIVIEQRRLAQRLMARIRQHRQSNPTEDDTQQAWLDTMTGVAFSLWRAAFLTSEKRTPTKVREQACDVLDRILTSNSFSFQDEKRCEDWMGGYYLNNARLRLEELLRIPSAKGKIREEGPVRELCDRYEPVRSNHDVSRLRDSLIVWRVIFDAAIAIVNDLGIDQLPDCASYGVGNSSGDSVPS